METIITSAKIKTVKTQNFTYFFSKTYMFKLMYTLMTGKNTFKKAIKRKQVIFKKNNSSNYSSYLEIPIF